MPENLPVRSDEEIREWIELDVLQGESRDQRLLLIIPDATRTAPLPLLFRSLHAHLAEIASAFDIIVALGTHPPMSEEAICQLIVFGSSRGSELANQGLRPAYDRRAGLSA